MLKLLKTLKFGLLAGIVGAICLLSTQYALSQAVYVPTTIQELDDVNTTDIGEDKILKWNVGQGKFLMEDDATGAPGGGITDINTLDATSQTLSSSDGSVVIASATSTHDFKVNSTQFFTQTQILALANLTNYFNRTTDIPLGTNTSGNYVASVATTAPITGGAAGSEGATLTIVIPKATTSVDGYLNSTDWTTFNGKMAGTLLKDLVTTAPLTGAENDIFPGADADVTLAITMTGDIVATAPVLINGTTAVNDILPGGDVDTTISLNMLGDVVATAPLLVNGTTNVDNILPGNDVDTTLSINMLGDLATTAPITGAANDIFPGTTGAKATIAIPKATTSVDGYLNSTDWTTFNNKIGSTQIDTWAELATISNMPAGFSDGVDDTGGSGGSGTSLIRNITQASHGLAVGNVIKFVTTYQKAQADSAANAEVVGIVSAVDGVNNFNFTMGGYISGLSSLSANSVYFLSPSSAGALTATEPTTAGQISKPVLIAISATEGYVFNFRGIAVAATATGEKGLSIYNITASHDIMIPPIAVAITLTKVSANGVGGTNVVGRLEDCSANGQTCARAINATDWTITSGTELEITNFGNATIPAGNWTKWNTTSVSGAVTNFAIGWDFTK